MKPFLQYLDQNAPNANVIHNNFNLPEFNELLERRSLYDFIRARHLKGKDNFVLIDEVQMCDGFKRTISGLHASDTALAFQCSDRWLQCTPGFQSTISWNGLTLSCP